MLFVEHYVEDLLVGLAHALAGELADRFNGLFNVVFEYSVTAVQSLALFVEVKAQKPGLDGRGNFRCARGLCTVANRAGYHAERICYRCGNGLVCAL